MLQFVGVKAKSPILYLRRKFDAFLLEWKAREEHLPLIVKGARQVGKTDFSNILSERHWSRPAFR